MPFLRALVALAIAAPLGLVLQGCGSDDEGDDVEALEGDAVVTVECGEGCAARFWCDGGSTRKEFSGCKQDVKVSAWEGEYPSKAVCVAAWPLQFEGKEAQDEMCRTLRKDEADAAVRVVAIDCGLHCRASLSCRWGQTQLAAAGCRQAALASQVRGSGTYPSKAKCEEAFLDPYEADAASRGALCDILLDRRTLDCGGGCRPSFWCDAATARSALTGCPDNATLEDHPEPYESEAACSEGWLARLTGNATAESTCMALAG